MLLTRSPLPHVTRRSRAFDLHVLSVPPAFVLSQDQTLRQNHNILSVSNPKAGAAESTLEIIGSTRTGFRSVECDLAGIGVADSF